LNHLQEFLADLSTTFILISNQSIDIKIGISPFFTCKFFNNNLS
jgi:hypothetical protein